MPVKVEIKYAEQFLDKGELLALSDEIQKAHDALHNGSGAGSDFIGWLDLPKNYDREEFARIKLAAEKIRSDTDIFIVIGIGGSYLGARAAIEYLYSPNYNLLTKDSPQIFFAGCNISSAALNEVLELCEGKRVSVNMISKSGTTTEPAIAFRVIREYMEKRYGREGARERIYCTTDKSKGTLKKLADEEGYEEFVVPDDIGGRYSVLTAVGLLPIAVSGADIDAIMRGAFDAMNDYCDTDINKNDCYRYAAVRTALYRKGYKIEMLTAYEPAFQMMCEWWKQLYGESEGKEHKGLFPASAIFSTDLHSMGQYIQDGQRIIAETVCVFDKPKSRRVIENDPANVDGLNFLTGETMDHVNRRAFEGTLLAHNDGGVPNIVVRIPSFEAYDFGYLVYFFEKACGISGYMLGVNPFNQPGVEAYKKNMFALLGKPGYESAKAELEARISRE